MRHTVQIMILIFLIACCEDKPDFYSLGLKSFSSDKFSLARNQLLMVKEDDSLYQYAQNYIKKIDSLEKLRKKLFQEGNLVKQRTKDSLMQRYAGNYMIEVNGVSSKNAVEVYLLKKNGNAVWLWVYDIDNAKKIDDRSEGWWTIRDSTIIINIRGNSGVIEETYKFNNGAFRNIQLKKRYLEKTLKTF